MQYPTFYRTTRVDDLSIFYREAGPKDAPMLLLLHGFPSSSRMFEPLFARLSDRIHLVAPDYPGFGHSDWPDPKQFDYTFDNIASVQTLAQRGAEFITEPKPKYGETLCYIRDPDGYIIEVGQSNPDFTYG